MLHAIAQHKSSHYRLYLGERPEGMWRVSEEDEITSTFLGPLDFMEPAAVYYFFREIFCVAGLNTALPDTPPLGIEMKLWPSMATRKDYHAIEPDAHFKLFWQDNKQLDILIEFKWRAPLSGEDQLHKQWMSLIEQSDINNCWHIFIGPNIIEGVRAQASQEINPWLICNTDHLILINWAQVRKALLRCIEDTQHNPSLQRWARLSDTFLNTIGIRPFKGFASINSSTPMLRTKKQWRFYGLTHGFKGFLQHRHNLPETKYFFQSFFNGENHV